MRVLAGRLVANLLNISDQIVGETDENANEKSWIDRNLWKNSWSLTYIRLGKKHAVN